MDNDALNKLQQRQTKIEQKPDNQNEEQFFDQWKCQTRVIKSIPPHPQQPKRILNKLKNYVLKEIEPEEFNFSMKSQSLTIASVKYLQKLQHCRTMKVHSIPINEEVVRQQSAAKIQGYWRIYKQERKQYKSLRKSMRYRMHIVSEIVEREISYVGHLETLCTKVLKELSNVMQVQEDLESIFGNVSQIYSFHAILSNELQIQFSNGDININSLSSDNNNTINTPFMRKQPAQRKFCFYSKIAIFFLEKFDKIRELYQMYCQHWNQALQCLNMYLHPIKNSQITQKIQSICQTSFDLHSLLIMPIQRITRYPLLFRDLKRRTKSDHPDFQFICQLCNKLAELNDQIDVSLDFQLHSSKIHTIQAQYLPLMSSADQAVFNSECVNAKFVTQKQLSIIKDDAPVPVTVIFLSTALLVVKAYGKFKVMHFLVLDAESLIKSLPDTKYFQCLFSIYGRQGGIVLGARDEKEKRNVLAYLQQNLILPLQQQNDVYTLEIQKQTSQSMDYTSQKILKRKTTLQRIHEKEEQIIKHIQVQVLGTTKRCDDYTIYICEIKYKYLSHRIFLRFNQLKQVEATIKSEFKDLCNEMPVIGKKTLLGKNKTRTIEQRSINIEAFLYWLMQNKSVQAQQGSCLIQMLTLPVNFFEQLRSLNNDDEGGNGLKLIERAEMIDRQIEQDIRVYGHLSAVSLLQQVSIGKVCLISESAAYNDNASTNIETLISIEENQKQSKNMSAVEVWCCLSRWVPVRINNQNMIYMRDVLHYVANQSGLLYDCIDDYRLFLAKLKVKADGEKLKILRVLDNDELFQSVTKYEMYQKSEQANIKQNKNEEAKRMSVSMMPQGGRRQSEFDSSLAQLAVVHQSTQTHDRVVLIMRKYLYLPFILEQASFQADYNRVSFCFSQLVQELRYGLYVIPRQDAAVKVTCFNIIHSLVQECFEKQDLLNIKIAQFNQSPSNLAKDVQQLLGFRIDKSKSEIKYWETAILQSFNECLVDVQSKLDEISLTQNINNISNNKAIKQHRSICQYICEKAISSMQVFDLFGSEVFKCRVYKKKRYGHGEVNSEFFRLFKEKSQACPDQVLIAISFDSVKVLSKGSLQLIYHIKFKDIVKCFAYQLSFQIIESKSQSQHNDNQCLNSIEALQDKINVFRFDSQRSYEIVSLIQEYQNILHTLNK